MSDHYAELGSDGIYGHVTRFVANHVAPRPPGLVPYRVPTDAQLTAMAGVLRALLACDAAKARKRLDSYNTAPGVAAPIDYVVRQYRDPGTTHTYMVLEERCVSDSTRTRAHGWGMYVVAPRSASTVVVEVPHPVADLHTEILGLETFFGADARALFVAGAHRYSIDGELADVAHQENTVFHAAHIAATLELRGGVAQVHGFDDPEIKEEVVLSRGRTDPSKLVLDLGPRLKDAGFSSTNTGKLLGTTNTQGNYTNAQPGALAADSPHFHFLHVEASRAVRDSVTRRKALGRALGAGVAAYEAGKPRTYLGFDTQYYPGDAVMRAWAAGSPLRFHGYYLEGTPGDEIPGFPPRAADAPFAREPGWKPEMSWKGRWRTLADMGWRPIPIYYGLQFAPENNPSPRTTEDMSRMKPGQGTLHGAQAVRIAAGEDLPDGAILFLDIEDGTNLDAKVLGPTDTANLAKFNTYIHEWLNEVATSEYRPGVYCGPLVAPSLGRSDVAYWVHNLACKPSKGCTVEQIPPPEECGFAAARVWQYAQSTSKGLPEGAGGCGNYDESTGQCTVSFGTKDFFSVPVDLNSAASLNPANAEPESEIPKPIPTVPWRPIKWIPIWLELTAPSSDGKVLIRIRNPGVPGGVWRSIPIVAPPIPPRTSLADRLLDGIVDVASAAGVWLISGLGSGAPDAARFQDASDRIITNRVGSLMNIPSDRTR